MFTTATGKKQKATALEQAREERVGVFLLEMDAVRNIAEKQSGE